MQVLDVSTRMYLGVSKYMVLCVQSEQSECLTPAMGQSDTHEALAQNKKAYKKTNG